MIRQFTATCYIVEGDKFLLLMHPKHERWLPPGGHLKLNETPPEAARREVREESGLEIAFISQENVWIEEWNAISIERPYRCLLANIPKRKNEPAHQHIDFTFVARPIGGVLTEGKWMTMDQIERLTPHEEIYTDALETIRQINRQLPSLVSNG